VPKRVIAGRGDRKVETVTSAERMTLVTICNAVNACSASIPPFFIFPHVHFKEVLLRNALTGSGGAAHRSGWMVVSTFIEWFKHFLKFAKPTTNQSMLLLLDNHETAVERSYMEDLVFACIFGQKKLATHFVAQLNTVRARNA